MEAYPSEYVEHNLPLVILSGLGDSPDLDQTHSTISRHEGGTKINITCPECSGERAESLLAQFRQLDGSDLPWNASSLPGSTGILRYRVRAIGRSYTLPPRKAAPLPQSTSTEGAPSGSPPRTELHSPLSPLSPGSPIFPDGLMTPSWLARHQHQVPSLILAFFTIDATGTADSDAQIKTDINAVRQALSRSGFKPRFAAVVLSDKSILNAPQVEERLSSIRRLTSLDAKTGLFFMPPMSSQGEIATFARGIMTALQPSCLEYYRELTKHARRKKTKGGSSYPSTPGGFEIKPLSTAGWGTRYEIKQGVFAEFRQEMDVAERHFSTAIDEMFAVDGVFETTNPSAPRWDEARLLCDSLAIRIVRCQLWTSQTTGAAQSWRNYQLRMRDLIGRKGKGLQTYSWDAWEARMAEVMSQLVQRADLESFRLPSHKNEKEAADAVGLQLYNAPEKAFATVERLPPFQSLHHAGYWLRLAAQRFRSRLEKALAIPAEDRVPPHESPASRLATRSASYDLYLVPEPNSEFTQAKARKVSSEDGQGYDGLVTLSQRSIEQFLQRGQTRLGDFVTLELAHDLINQTRYEESLRILRPLWEGSTWRGEDWHDIFIDLLLAIRKCAEHLEDSEIMLTTTYELISISPQIPSDLSLDLLGSMEAIKDGTSLALSFRDRQRLAPISLSFAFKDGQTHVGDSLHCQLIVRSHARTSSNTLRLSSIRVKVGLSKTVVLTHSSDSPVDGPELVDFGELAESVDGLLPAAASLVFEPGQHRIFSFRLIFRESSVFRVNEASILFSNEYTTIEHTFTEASLQSADSFYLVTETGSLDRVLVANAVTTAVRVLPKPPKVKMVIVGHKHEYYAGENIRLVVQLKNHELETIEGSLSASLPSESEDSIPLTWIGGDDGHAREQALQDLRDGPATTTIPKVASKDAHQLLVYAKAPNLPAKVEILIDLKYFLSSDLNTPLWKSLTIGINIALPFDGKYNFGPLLYTGAWPSYFDPEMEEDDQKRGIPQLWRLGCKMQSLVSHSIVVHDVQSVIDGVAGDSDASSRRAMVGGKQVFKSSQTEMFNFELSTQKNSLDDRRPTSVDSSLAITWSRDEKDEHVTTYLAIPRLTLPVSEPRVLCTVSQPKTEDVCDAVLQYHIENPSTHFLTFAVSMEATEDFAFSGPKYRTLSLAPLSRYKVVYRITLQEQDDDQSSSKDGDRWIWPMLQVTDSYYQKTLRVHPGGVGIRADEKQDISVLVKTT